MNTSKIAATLGAMALCAASAAMAGPQIFIQQSGNSPAAGDPNVISNTASFTVGIAGNHTLQDPLLIIVGEYDGVGGTPTISFSGCSHPASCPLAVTGTLGPYGLQSNMAAFDASSPNDAYGTLGLSTQGDNSESFTNWIKGDIKNGFASPTGFELYAFSLDTSLGSSSDTISIDESGAANGSYIIAYDCEGTGAAGSSCSMGNLAKTVFTNTGILSSSTVPEPGTLLLFAAGLAGLGFTLSRRSKKI